MKTYFAGFYKKSNKTLVLQLVRDKDFLSRETWLFYGERICSKTAVKQNKAALLAEINRENNKNFKHLIIE